MGSVSDYKVYCLDDAGRIAMWVNLKCANDAEAIKRAREYCGEYRVELWQGDRKLHVVGCDADLPKPVRGEA